MNDEDQTSALAARAIGKKLQGRGVVALLGTDPVWLLAAFGPLHIRRYGSLYVLQRTGERRPYHDHFATDRLKSWQSLGGAWMINAGTLINDSAER